MVVAKITNCALQPPAKTDALLFLLDLSCVYLFFILSMAAAMFLLKSLPGLHAPMFRIHQGARCCCSVSFFSSLPVISSFSSGRKLLRPSDGAA